MSEAAIGRLLEGYYNSDPAGAGNPGGLAAGGHVQNFPAALADVGAVGALVAGAAPAAVSAAASAALSGAHATASETSRLASETAAAGVVLAGLINPVINGGFDIWQRGTSFVHTGAFAYFADRWGGRRGANMPGFTVSRVAGSKGRYAARLRRAEGDADTNNFIFNQTFELDDSVWWRGRTARLVYRARRSAVASIGLQCRCLVGGGSSERMEFVFPTQIATVGVANASLSENFGDFSVPLSFPADFTQIGVGFTISISGTGGADDYIDIEQVRLVPGVNNLPFQPRPLAQELALCRRFFQRRGVWVPAAKAHLGNIDMRGVPTITGGGSGANFGDTSAASLIGFQTTAGLQTLDLNSEI